MDDVTQYEYGIEEDVDDIEDDTDSSDDDLDNFLSKSKSSRHTHNQTNKRSASSSEDEFEKEINSELHETMKEMGRKHREQMQGSSKQTDEQRIADEHISYYDKDYFDSDSDDDFTSEEKTKQKHRIVSNNDLFYDPADDDNNQKWVDQMRQGYLNQRTTQLNGRSKHKPPPNSDAVLNCPGCMTTLCLDCQRHETYRNQYRAMFTMNCNVVLTEQLKFPSQKKIRQKKRNKSSSVPETDDKTADCQEEAQDAFNPVRCSECNTEVGVRDRDEVFHFFNVLSGYG